jgi:predicted enzyme related to lactoylglutathione lyase
VAAFALGSPMPPTVPAVVPAYWGTYFVVSDCATVDAHAKDLGGSVLVPTMSVPSGEFAVLNDPAGASFSIIEYAS